MSTLSNHVGVTEAAQRVGMTRRGILAAIERGELPASRLGVGRSPYVISEKDVDAFGAKRAGQEQRAGKVGGGDAA